jgi:tetratricopeptide (TPR) repeat protein
MKYRGMRGRLGACAVIVCAMLAGAADGVAQTTSATTPADANAQLDRLFERMLREPANLDLMFEYAQLAVSVGNYDAALGTLSRMLLFNPNLPRVRLELGALYFQVGSYEAARSYIAQALTAPDVPPEIRERANAYLAEIDKRTALSVFTGAISVGIRWQQNANSGPGTANVRALGQDALLDNQFLRQSDWNLFALANLQHRYTLDRYSGHALETTLALYGTRQFEIDELDVALAEVTTGPRFTLGDTGPGFAYLRPYVLANIVGLDDARYYYTGGAGLGFTQQFGDRLALDVAYERREKRFRNSAARPFATDQDSGENALLASVRYAVSSDVILTVGGTLADENADQDYRSNKRATGGVSVSYYYNPDWFWSTQPWSVTLGAQRLYTKYDEPDAGVDPNVERVDREWRFALVNVAQITDEFSVFTQVQRYLVDSNLPNFTYNNWALSAGVTWSF